MRKKIAVAALGLSLAAAFAPLGSASAYCMVDLSPVGPSCANPCTIVGGAYQTADGAAHDKLPELGVECPA